MKTFKLFRNTKTNVVFISDQVKHYGCKQINKVMARNWIDAKSSFGFSLTTAQHQMLAC